MGFFSFLKPLGSLITRAFNLVKAAGLDDDLVALALKHVRLANDRFVDPAEKREYVVAYLQKRGVPETVARIATELAYRLYKKQVEERYGV